MFLLSAIREGGTCAERVACSLGRASKSAFESPETIVELMDLFVPNKYANFTTSLESVLNSEDTGTCSQECKMCSSF